MTPLQESRLQHDKRRLKRLKKSLFAIKDPFSNIEEIRKLNEEIVPLEKRLNIIESMELEIEAGRLGIDIPTDKEGWWEDTGSEILKGQMLTEIGKEGVRKLIKEERFRVIKRWAEILIPILSLLVAILALTRK